MGAISRRSGRCWRSSASPQDPHPPSAARRESEGTATETMNPHREERMGVHSMKILCAAIVAATCLAAPALADDIVFMSTQLRPLEEAQKLRDVILKNFPEKVTFVPEEPAPLATRMKAEAEAGKRTVSLIAAGHGELQPLQAIDALDPIDDIAAKLGHRGIPASLM